MTDQHQHPHPLADPDAPARPRKQEQEEASTEVTEVAPGVLRTQLPISMPGLGHVNCYVMEDERGIAIVDPGLPGPEPWDDLVDRLRRAGYQVADVHTVVVTHSHPDHFGGALRMRYETDAEMLLALRRIVHDHELRDELADRGHAIRTGAWSETAHIDRYFGLIQGIRAGRSSIPSPHRPPSRLSNAARVAGREDGSHSPT